MTSLIPQAIVRELDKYIVGQEEAKRAVAIALCTRERRKRLPPELRQEVAPKNILMIGPTGVGKTEIARRVSNMINAPFIKVEATKFTEVGYVGRDVDSIISELVESSTNKVYEEKLEEVESKAEKIANEKLVNYLCRQLNNRGSRKQLAKKQLAIGSLPQVKKAKKRTTLTQKLVASLLQNHQLDDHIVEIEVENGSESINHPTEFPYYEEDNETRDAFNDLIDDLKGYGKSQRKRRVSVKEARRILVRAEAGKLLDYSQVIEEAIARAQENGVVFVDELDKLISPRIEVGRDISGEGVQRDLLPLLEGSTVMTRYGPVKTDHILFIAAGSFYQNKPSDLIPELQGRFPLRVELKPLSQKHLQKILVEPHNSLVKQYQALLATEGVGLIFTQDSIEEIARLAKLMNERNENIGARRLNTIMEKVLEEINFAAPEKAGGKVIINTDYVRQHIGNLIQDEDLTRYIL